MTCLGAVAAALVDGELDHAGRERAQRHLAHCPACRAEVEAQRSLKAQLSGTPGWPVPSDALTSRLMGLSTPVGPGDSSGPSDGPVRRVSARAVAARAVQDRAVPGRAVPGRTIPGRRAVGRPEAQRPVTERSPTAAARRSWPGGVSQRRLVRRTAVGSALLGLGLGAALVLGGPQAQAPSTPLDPGNDTFVTQFVSTTSGGTGNGQ